MAARRSSPAPSPGSSRRCSCECSAPWMPSSARMTPPRVPGCAAITMPWAGRPWRSCANRRAWCARLTTWTRPALASEARRYSHELWRVVEAQHTASTMRLVDSLEEQASLELVLEESKPPLPPEARRHHYLLATPFRYRPHVSSRFRAALEAGVWYGAEALRTALAEKSYWRLRLLRDSPATPALKPVPHTAFRVGERTAAAAELALEPLVRDRSVWGDPVGCQGA